MLYAIGNKNIGSHCILKYNDMNTMQPYNVEENHNSVVLGIYAKKIYFETYEKKLILHYYKSDPTSSEYKTHCNCYTSYFIPLVYIMDENGKPQECLNTEIKKYQITKNDGKDRWIDFEVELTRNVNFLESLFVGIYADYLTPTYYKTAGLKAYSHKLQYVTPLVNSSDFKIEFFKTLFTNIFYSSNIEAEREYSFYYEYYDSPLPINYERKVNDEIELDDSKYKTKIGFCRNPKSNEKITDKLKRITDLERFEESKIEHFSSIYKHMQINRCKNDRAEIFDNSQREVGFCIKLKSEIFAKAVIRICRDLKITIKTVLSFWDFVKKSIIKEDTTITFFSPITIELDLESKV